MKDVVPPIHKLRAFLCHSSGDKAAARDLYYRLSADGVDPWLDAEKLLPGQDWELEIRKAVKESDVIIVCLSERSISKRGFVQKEIRYALDVADEQPEGAIFLIPLRLEECDIPNRLCSKQWVDYFQADGYARLTKALEVRARELRIDVPFHRRGTASKSRARRLTGRLRSSPALIALLILGPLLILSISFIGQRLRRGQEPSRTAFEQESSQLNQPAESVPSVQHSESPSSNTPSQLTRRRQASEIGFTLFPNLVRGDGERSTITPSRNVETLRLRLLLLADKYQSYRGELRTEDGKTLLDLTNLQVGTQDGHEAVIMTLSIQGLASGDYSIKLSGKTADGETQEIARYYFRVLYR